MKKFKEQCDSKK